MIAQLRLPIWVKQATGAPRRWGQKEIQHPQETTIPADGLRDYEVVCLDAGKRGWRQLVVDIESQYAYRISAWAKLARGFARKTFLADGVAKCVHKVLSLQRLSAVGGTTWRVLRRPNRENSGRPLRVNCRL